MGGLGLTIVDNALWECVIVVIECDVIRMVADDIMSKHILDISNGCNSH